jgi:hypothetical protein
MDEKGFGCRSPSYLIFCQIVPFREYFFTWPYSAKFTSLGAFPPNFFEILWCILLLKVVTLYCTIQRGVMTLHAKCSNKTRPSAFFTAARSKVLLHFFRGEIFTQRGNVQRKVLVLRCLKG